MKLKIPLISQNDESFPQEWKEKACAIACLKMCLDYKGKIISPLDLINEGQIINAYAPGLGWRHDGLVRLAHNHGIPAYQEEFRSINVDLLNKTFSSSNFEKDLLQVGVNRIKESIEKNVPVIVSVLPGFGSKVDTHLVLITGFDNDGFLVNDPSISSPKEGEFVAFDAFQKIWRKFAIFVG